MARNKKRGKHLGDLIEAIHFLEDVSAKVHGLLDEAEIYKTVRKEFAGSKRYTGTILLLTDDGSQVRIAETSLSPVKRKKGMKAPRLRLKGRKLNLGRSALLSRVVRGGEIVQASLGETVGELFPRSLASQISKSMDSEVRSILTPLKRHGEIVGVLVISGPEVSSHLTPSVERLAQHTSTALELAREYADRRQGEEELRSSREQLRNLSGYLQSVREEERTHIAREMHDELGQTLTALKMDLSGLKADLPKEAEELSERMSSSLALTDRTIQTVKRISAELRPRLLDTLGLAAAMGWEGKDFGNRTGIVCVVTVEPEDLVLDRALSTAIFRVFQEALTNVARHAKATRVEVSLKEKGDKLKLEVRDNGKGTTQEQISHPKSFGLIGMRERVRSLGGEFEVKGIKDRGTTVRASIPLLEPVPRRLVSTPRLVGREKELRRLRSLLKRADREEGKLVFIRGEAGVGKTRLVTELGQDLETRGGRVLWGNCREDTRSVAYYPFREAFNRYFERVGVQFIEPILLNLPDYSQWELARILPGLEGPESSRFEPAKDPFRLFESFRLFIETLAAGSKGPVFLIIEDLHLSGDATLDLLHYLARNLAGEKVLLCATYRTEEAGENLQSFTTSLKKEKLSEVLTLEPLSSEDVSAMLDLLCEGVDTPEGFREFLYQRTEGNPFFVEELVKLVSEEDVTERLTRVKEVPLAIQAVLKRRVSSLNAGVREILSCAAVVGEEFEFEVLRGALGRPEMEVMEAVEVGARSHIVRESTRDEEERYRFIHALMADVLYSGIGKARRRLWHGRVGEALEQVYAGRLGQLNGQLTYHFELGENWEKAFKYALTSAKQAKEAYANQEAIRLYEKAREILPRLSRCDSGGGDEKIAIAEGLGQVHKTVGEYEKALEEYRLMQQSARRKGEEKKEGDAHSKMSWVYHCQGNYDEMMSHAERSYAICRRMGDRQGLADSLLCIGRVHWNRGDYGEALKCHEKSLKIRREIGDKRGVAASLNNIGMAHTRRGDYAEALECYEESLKINTEIGDRRDVANSLNNIGNAHTSRQDYGGALKCHEESLKIRREIGDRSGVAYSLANMGKVHEERGDYAEASKCFEESLRICREIGDKGAVAVISYNMGVVHDDRGEHKEASKCHEESLRIRREIGDRYGVASSLSGLGSVSAHQGQYGDAMKCHEESLKIRREISDKEGLGISLHNIGIVHSYRGNYVEALSCLKESSRICKEIGDEEGVAVNLRGIGVLHVSRGEYAEALKCYEGSLAIETEVGSKSGVASSLHNIGAVHSYRGDYGEALEYIRRSLKIKREVSDKRGTASCLLTMGTVHQDLGDLEKATEYHQSSLALAEETGAESDKAKILTAIGADCHLSGDPEKALEYLKKTLKTIERAEYGQIEPEVLTALSEVWVCKGDTRKASEYCERLLEMAEKEELKGYLARGEKIKGEILLAQAVGCSRSAVRRKQADSAPLLRRGDIYDARPRSQMLKDAEAELKAAQKIAEEIGALPLLWQIHASLGKVYSASGGKAGKEKASKQFAKAKEIIQTIGSTIGDDELTNTFLNSKEVQSVLTA